MHDAVEVNNASVKIMNSGKTCLMMLIAIQATMIKTYLLDLCFLPLNFPFPYVNTIIFYTKIILFCYSPFLSAEYFKHLLPSHPVTITLVFLNIF